MFLAVVAAEVVLRQTLREVREYYVWWPHLQRTFQVEAGLMPGVEGRTQFLVSSIGLRADELSEEDDYRMLAVGGSTTECLFLDQDIAWPEGVEHVLNQGQDRLRVWMGNAGKSGLNTRDHIVQLKHILPLVSRVDAVVMMIGVNDMMLRLSRDDDYNPDFMQEENAETVILPRSFQMLPIQHETRYLAFQKTALWRLATRVKDSLFESNKVQDNAGRNIIRWREHRNSAPAWLDELPDITAGLKEYRRNIRELIRICRECGVRPVFMTQPAIWTEDFPEALERYLWVGGIGDYMEVPGSTYYTVDVLMQAMELYNASVLDICAQEGVDCFDVAAVLPRNTASFYDDIHFNAGGGKRVSELFGAYMLERAPFSE